MIRVDHRIPPGSVWLENFACQTPIVKNSADRRVVTDLFRNLQVAERRRHSPANIAESVLRR